jgi:predicted aspartyl protease
MHPLRRYGAFAILLLVTMSASAQLGGPPPPDPQRILAEAKEASGGAAWDSLRTQHSKVTIQAAGLSGTAERWSDIATGRSSIVFSIGPITGAAGYDGTKSWSQDGESAAKAETSDAGRELAVNAAYRDRLAFWYPDRARALVAYKERTSADGADFHVIRITPEGGRAFELWINTETKLIERLVEREAQETRTEFYMDLRDVQGVKIPFRVRASRGDPRSDEVVIVEAMDFRTPLSGVQFAQPAPPKPDFAFPAGQAAVEIPFETFNGHLFVRVRINGKGPFRMLLDSGGSNVISPKVAAQAGLKVTAPAGAADGGLAVGAATAEHMDIGGVMLDRQRFATIDLAAFMQRVEGLDDVAGVVGYELFKRFPVKLDFSRSRAVLFNPASFKYAGTGTAVPITFRGTVPQVNGRMDGVEGQFDIDTGSRGSLTLSTPFAETNGLAEKYGAKLNVISGAGLGGHVHALLARAASLQIGDVTITNPVTALTLQAKGPLASPDLAGNIGFGILRQFDITFDYANSVLYLEKNSSFGQLDTYDRAGLWIERAGKGFEVVDVVEGGPAASAGMKVGDVIVAVNGKAWTASGLAAARAAMKGAPGAKLRLKIASGAERVVTLRDLI